MNAHPGVYTRESAFTRTLGAYMQEVRLRTRVRIREIVRLRERGVRIRCVCVYAPGAYTRVGVYTRALGAFTQRVRTRTRVRIRG